MSRGKDTSHHRRGVADRSVMAMADQVGMAAAEVEAMAAVADPNAQAFLATANNVRTLARQCSNSCDTS